MFKIVDRGLIEYAEAWNEQRAYFDALLADAAAQEVVMLCEHPHVYTLGKSGHANNLLVDDDFLRKINATYFKTDRGGDITYHGYGQLVGYPILNIQTHGLSLKGYIEALEQAIIDAVAALGIKADRLPGATGVWIDGQRKIAAIGVKASRYVTMHGFALNVTTDLKYFSYINPCGFIDKGVTSIRKECPGIELTDQELMERVKILFIENFERLMR